MRWHLKGDLYLFASIIALTTLGFIVFISASMGLFARGNIQVTDIIFSQAVFGLGGGLIAFCITYRIHYKTWAKYAFYILLVALGATLLVFVPGLGFSHGGATRWVDLGFTTFQPSELLKIAFIIYFATWIASARTKITTWQWGFMPFVVLTGISGAVILFQPDTDTFLLLAGTGLIMFFTAGAPWKHVGTLLGLGVIGITVIALMRPYIMDRILTFLDPSRNPLGSSYQIQQSLIAIGSGGLTGRGVGQSVQKFNFLPEPIGDSVFAVAAEEFGFVGAMLLISLFLLFAFRGFKVAIEAPDTFGRMLGVGIVTLIVSQSFLNIGAMLGIVPLAGMPLLFVSHGGTALMLTLASVGILMNISKYRRKPRATG